MAISSIKLRTLYIMKILLERTDEQNVMSAVDLDNALKSYGMSIDRKTVYNDIETLQEFGLGILQQKGTNAGYYIGERDFELPELKLLVDAVQSSKFITKKKSNQLIEKLENLAGKNDAKQLRREVYIYNRPKTDNETIYYNVDQIHTAILSDKQISFQYTEWGIDKKLHPKRLGERYVVSPWALTWDDENYYLIAYDESLCIIKHYRVDKMQHLNIETKSRSGRAQFQNFDLATFAKKTFGMYGGRDENIKLYCHNSLIGVVFDRFGQDVMIIPKGETHFCVNVLVAVSPQFFGWVTGVGKGMEIVTPNNVRIEYQEYLKEILGEYKEAETKEDTGYKCDNGTH